MTSAGAHTDRASAAPDGAPAAFEPPAASDADGATLARLAWRVSNGAPWAPALLDAIGAWTAPREEIDGREIQYLVGGEAFDWLLLAERLVRALAAAAPSSVPAAEAERLLFTGELPPDVSQTYFQEALGVSKYRAHLNFFYGVVVEEALWHAVEGEVLKERGVRGLHHLDGVQETVGRRLYRADPAALMRQFRRERGEKPSVKFSLSEMNEYAYWLFKLRVSRSDSARTASDTRKGLAMLSELRGASAGPVSVAGPSEGSPAFV